MRGPIDYMVVEFDGNEFNGEILDELDKAVHDKTINVLELAVVIKDEDGNVAAAEVTDKHMAETIEALTSEPGLATDENIADVGNMLERGTSAGLLIIENLWAKGLKKAVMDSGGTLIDGGRLNAAMS